jgi:hypothetical protein
MKANMNFGEFIRFFPNKFGPQINLIRGQKQFCFLDFSFKFSFQFELDSTIKVVPYLLISHYAKYGNFWISTRVIFPICNSAQFAKFKINCYRVGVTTVCSLSQTGSRHFQIPTPAWADPKAAVLGRSKDRCFGLASWASVQWATVAMGCSEAWRNSELFPFRLDLFKSNSNSIQFQLKSPQICSNRIFE